MVELKKIKNEVASKGLFDSYRLNKNQRTLNSLPKRFIIVAYKEESTVTDSNSELKPPFIQQVLSLSLIHSERMNGNN